MVNVPLPLVPICSMSGRASMREVTVCLPLKRKGSSLRGFRVDCSRVAVIIVQQGVCLARPSALSLVDCDLSGLDGLWL